MPFPEWDDPPKSRIAELLAATLRRIHDAGFSSLAEICELARDVRVGDAGLDDPRVTTDAKHVEIGLTDKTDASHELFPLLASLGVPAEDVLVCGDEMGPLGGEPGSDSLMLVGDGERATAVSVGVEPEGVPGRRRCCSVAGLRASSSSCATRSRAAARTVSRGRSARFRRRRPPPRRCAPV